MTTFSNNAGGTANTGNLNAIISQLEDLGTKLTNVAAAVEQLGEAVMGGSEESSTRDKESSPPPSQSQPVSSWLEPGREREPVRASVLQEPAAASANGAPSGKWIDKQQPDMLKELPQLEGMHLFHDIMIRAMVPMYSTYISVAAQMTLLKWSSIAEAMPAAQLGGLLLMRVRPHPPHRPQRQRMARAILLQPARPMIHGALEPKLNWKHCAGRGSNRCGPDVFL